MRVATETQGVTAACRRVQWTSQIHQKTLISRVARVVNDTPGRRETIMRKHSKVPIYPASVVDFVVDENKVVCWGGYEFIKLHGAGWAIVAR